MLLGISALWQFTGGRDEGTYQCVDKLDTNLHSQLCRAEVRQLLVAVLKKGEATDRNGGTTICFFLRITACMHAGIKAHLDNTVAVDHNDGTDCSAVEHAVGLCEDPQRGLVRPPPPTEQHSALKQ